MIKPFLVASCLITLIACQKKESTTAPQQQQSEGTGFEDEWKYDQIKVTTFINGEEAGQTTLQLYAKLSLNGQEYQIIELPSGNQTEYGLYTITDDQDSIIMFTQDGNQITDTIPYFVNEITSTSMTLFKFTEEVMDTMLVRSEITYQFKRL